MILFASCPPTTSITTVLSDRHNHSLSRSVVHVKRQSQQFATIFRHGTVHLSRYLTVLYTHGRARKLYCIHKDTVVQGLMVRLRGACGVSGVVCWGKAIGFSGERSCTYTQGLHGHGPGWAWIQGDQVSTNSYTIGKAVGRGSPGAHPPPARHHAVRSTGHPSAGGSRVRKSRYNNQSPFLGVSVGRFIQEV